MTTDEPRPRVLVVDDDAELLSIVHRALDGDYAVTSTPSSVEALAGFRRGDRYDVVLTDVAMPDLSGIELLAAVNAFDPEQGGRFVFMSGTTTSVVGHASLEKPFTMQTLRAALIRALAGR